MPMNFERAKEIMEERGLDALLASSPENFFYASDLYIPFVDRFRGFSSGFGSFALVPLDGEPTLSTTVLDADLAKKVSTIEDQRYTRTWAYFRRDKHDDIDVYENPVSALASIVEEKDLEKATIGIEEKVLPIKDYKEITTKLPDVELVDSSKTFLDIRAIKVQEEIDRIRRACEISEKGFDAAFSVAKEGATEADFLGAFQRAILDEGGYIDKGLIHQNLTIGKHSATVRRGWPLEHKLKEGGIMRFDGGAVYKGYRCDFARSRVLGKPSDKAKKVYAALRKAQSRIVDMIEPGVKFSRLYEIGLSTVREMGDPDFLRGHFGHGLGLITEEEPLVAADNDIPLEEDMVLSIEVPYYWVGVGGFNVEDVVRVTSDGHEVFTPNLHRDLTL